jgi:hypothetical protein
MYHFVGQHEEGFVTILAIAVALAIFARYILGKS